MKKEQVERGVGFHKSLLPTLASVVFLLFLATNPVPAKAQSAGCKSDSDCALGDKCSEGTCQVAECDTAQDCPNAGNRCVAVVCDFPDDDDAGSLTCIENRIEGAACALNSDCGRAQVCDTSKCECVPDTDCDGIADSDDKCSVNHCPQIEQAAFQLTQEVPVETCNTDAQCNLKFEIALIQVKDGITSADINAPADVKKVCENCQCVSACSVKNCDDGDDCTTDGCDDATGECTHAKIDNCPTSPPTTTPPVDTTPVQEQSACVSNLVSSLGFSPEEARVFESQGFCSGALEGQSARACSLYAGPAGSPWSMLFPLLSGTGWIGWWRFSRKGQK